MSAYPFIKYLFWKRGALPISLILEVTSACNSRCPACYNWRKVEQARIEEIPLDKLERIASTMSPHLLVLLLSGGEPFLRKDLVDVVEVFSACTGVEHINIPTNCLLPARAEEAVRAILKSYTGKLVVQLSLDGVGDLHDRIRGVRGNFSDVVECYRRLAAIPLRNGNLDISVVTTLSSLNQDRYRDIARYVREQMPLVKNHNFNLLRGEPRSPDVRRPSRGFLESNLQGLKHAVGLHKGYRTGIQGRILRGAKKYYFDLAARNISAGRMTTPCYAGQLAAYIDCAGNLWPCESYASRGQGIPLEGHGWDFSSAWSSSRMEAMRCSIREGACFCDHGCFYAVNEIFNPGLYPRIAWESLR